MGASGSSPLDPGSVASSAAAKVLPAITTDQTPLPPPQPRQQQIIQQLVAEAKPHRCASRIDDFAMSLYEFNFGSSGNRFSLFLRCMRSEIGSEPRDPHINLPPERLPKWDPAHPQYDPNAPFDSFPKPVAGHENIGK